MVFNPGNDLAYPGFRIIPSESLHLGAAKLHLVKPGAIARWYWRHTAERQMRFSGVVLQTSLAVRPWRVSRVSIFLNVWSTRPMATL
jgi:hypothetical protein